MMKHLNEFNKKKIGHFSIPMNIWDLLIKSNNIEEMCHIIRDNEHAIASSIFNDDYEEFIDCDNAADILSEVLKTKKIPHCCVLGKSDEGSSHAFVVANGIKYDPTYQGFGDGKYEVIYKYPK